MKADAKPTFEAVALALCKGAAPPDWIVPRLREWAAFIADTTEDQGDNIDRQMLKSAVYLETMLPFYARVYEMIGEDPPDCLARVSNGLFELIPILAQGVERPKRGPKPDIERHLCAAVCMNIWREYWGQPQPHSPRLWGACEAYWLACGREGYSSAHIKNWEDYLLQNIDPPSNPTETS